MPRPCPASVAGMSSSQAHERSVSGRNSAMLLRRARGHVVRQQVRQAAHEAHPQGEGREAAQHGGGTGHDEHGDGIGEAGRDEGARPQADVGRGPCQHRREQPPHGDQQMGEPAGHVARPSRYPLRVRATRASAVRTRVNAPPAAAGTETAQASWAIAPTMTAPAMAGSALRPSAACPPPLVAWLAVTIPPIQARNVPSIHHTGRYHQVLPPPIASHVQGYALKGRSSTMSIALNTTVPTQPTAAAPAIPSVPRAAVQCAGKKATTTAAASTTRASTPPRTASPARLRDAATTSTTATPVTRPTRAPPTVTVRKSERSCAAVAVADMRPSLLFEERRRELT